MSGKYNFYSSVTTSTIGQGNIVSINGNKVNALYINGKKIEQDDLKEDDEVIITINSKSYNYSGDRYINSR